MVEAIPADTILISSRSQPRRHAVVG